MSSVAVSIGGALISLSEKEAGKYSADTVAPAKSGSYPISVSMVSTLGQSIEKKDVTTLTITEPTQVTLVPRFLNLKATTTGKRVTFSFEVVDEPETLSKFKIAYGESANALSQEVVTYTKDKIQ